MLVLNVMDQSNSAGLSEETVVCWGDIAEVRIGLEEMDVVWLDRVKAETVGTVLGCDAGK